MSTTTLKISEIFYSLQGETSRTGLPTVFVRLTGLPPALHLVRYGIFLFRRHGLALDDILGRGGAPSYPPGLRHGGEPLAQKNCLPLLAALCDAGYDVSLETSGAWMCRAWMSGYRRSWI